MLIVGQSIFQRKDSNSVFSLISLLAEKLRLNTDRNADWRVLNILNRVRSHMCFLLCCCFL